MTDHLLYFLGRKVFKWKKNSFTVRLILSRAQILMALRRRFFDDTGNDGEKGKQNCFCFHTAGLLYFKKTVKYILNSGYRHNPINKL